MNQDQQQFSLEAWQTKPSIGNEPVAINIHCVKLKSRKKMEATIPKKRLGWWHDVCLGERMVLRDATDSDIARCSRKTSDTRGPEHFFAN